MIYQGFYRNEQKSCCDHYAEVIDTREILGSSCGEFEIIKYLLNQDTEDDWFGYFSWKTDLKIGGAFRRFLCEVGELKDRYDFVFVNAMIMGRAIFGCPYHQGEWSGHRGMMKCAEELNLLEDFRYYAMNHFVVGNRRFWDFYMEYHQNLDRDIAKASPDVRHIMLGSAGYVRNSNIPMNTFIRERALNNVMNRSGLNGHAFLLPFENFAAKYGCALGEHLGSIYRQYQSDTLDLRPLLREEYDPSRLAQTLTQADDPNFPVSH
jgi:hypothetical protein